MSKEIMHKFYESFQKLDGETMGSYYHENAIFNDPAFTNLNSSQVKAMWKMLIERSKGNLKIEFHSLAGDDHLAQCTWEAYYPFSQTGNQVHNIIHSTMKFEDGLIISHTDEFNFWRWSSMALGTPGKLLGWTPFLKNKVRKMAMNSLDKYMNKS